MGVFYVIHVFDPHSAATVLVEVLFTVLIYKTLAALVSKLLKNGKKD